jgi:PAS domain-containing protein
MSLGRELPEVASLVDLASDLFDAAYEPALWPPALSRLAAELACDRILLLRADGVRRIVLATSDLDPGAVRRLAGRRADPDAERLLVLPARHREVPLGGDPSLRLLVDRAELDAAAEELLRLFGPLVAKAWKLTDTLAASRRHQVWNTAVLDRLPTGALVLDAAGRVLQANAAARRLLASQGELAVERGHLRARSIGLQRSLAELLARAARFDGRGAATESLLLPREAPHGPLETLIVASPRFADADPMAVAVALVFDPRREEENPAVVLARRHHLSFEEAQVLALLLRGRDIPEIAAALDVPAEAVAACLRNLYEQVGTTRQVELIKVLLARSSGAEP